MLDEITTIESNGTWELVVPPLHCCPIGLKWVFKAKKDADNIISRTRATSSQRAMCGDSVWILTRCSCLLQD
jgi:hypothetical protein